MRFLLVISATALLGACAATAEPAPPGGRPTGQMMTQGRALAEQKCAQCHAIYATGASPNSIAPPFRTLGGRYDEATLSRKLADIETGHYEMPPLTLNGDQIMSLMDYMRQVSPAPTGPDGTR